MTLTETNQGTVPVQVIGGNGTFNVTQNGNLVWASGPEMVSPDPGFSWQTLGPGQALTETATWNAKGDGSGPAPYRGLSR